MKTKKIILIILLGLLVAGTGWLLLKKYPSASVGHTQGNIYYCPMHPNYTSDRPGLCPICNMSLVKREAKKETSPVPSPASSEDSQAHQQHSSPPVQSAFGYATVSLDQTKQKLMNLKTAKVVKKPFVKTIRAVGNFIHDLELYKASFEYADAWRSYRLFRTRRIVKDEFREAYLRFLQAEYELQHMGLNDQELAELREVKFGQSTLTRDLAVFSEKPFQEYAETFRQPMLNRDLAVFHGVLDSFVYAEIFEDDVELIKAGQKVTIEIPGSGKTLAGTVSGVSSQVDPQTRRIRARIKLSEHYPELKANRYVNVVIPIQLEESLLIPRDAAMTTGLRTIVFVEKDPGTFEPREITIGDSNENDIQVLKGLNENDMVVNGANFLIDSESRLEAALQNMSGQSGGGHVHGQ